METNILWRKRKETMGENGNLLEIYKKFVFPKTISSQITNQYIY